MWGFTEEFLDGERTRRVVLTRDEKPMKYAEAIAGWCEDESFRSSFFRTLTDVGFSAYFWETPPITRATVEQTFEFVQVESRPLAALPPDPVDFEERFRHARDGIAAFPNLGGDAFLLAPTPEVAWSAYGHLAAFAREAPQAQQHALWKEIGDAMAAQIGDDPVWLSTAGLGVAWLHVRLDSRPKYYSHAPYRRRP